MFVNQLEIVIVSSSLVFWLQNLAELLMFRVSCDGGLPTFTADRHWYYVAGQTSQRGS